MPSWLPGWAQWAVALGIVGICTAVVYGRLAGRDEVFVGAGAAFVVLLAVAGIPEHVRFWRGESPRARRRIPPSWWPWSPALWRGNVRSSSVLAVGAVPMLGSAVLLLAVHDLGWPAPPGEWVWYPLLRLTLIAAWILVPLLGVSVVLFNRPKAVVPPHLRDEPGLLER